MIQKRYIAAFLTLISFRAFSQQQLEGIQAEAWYPGATAVYYNNGSQSPSNILFKANSITETGFFNELRIPFQMQFADTWKKYRSDADEIQMVHHRYQQYYQGLKVEQGEYILHEKNNYIVSANGVFYKNLSLPTVPSLSEAAALKSALADVHATRYKWQMPEEEALLKKIEKNNLATYYPKGELLVVPINENNKNASFTLAYKFDVYADEPMSRQYIYVDALSGKIVKKINRICEFIATGTASTMYNGTKSIITDSVSPGNYRLRDISRGGGVETYNMNSGTNYGAAVDFTDADNIWNTVANQDHAAYDAHYGAQMTYDYYLNILSRNGYDNLGSPFRSYVHFFTNYNNAFWNGSLMSYGDGNGTNYSPLTTLDVCAHELTHGVTEYSSNLIYANESGALNESFSDIAGVSVDYFANPGGANFLIGEQCYTPLIPGDALRYMNNPNLSTNPNPDTYLGTYWYSGTADNGGVHTNSGVQNFWYYLLCQGGTGTNDFGYVYNVAGIGINNARLIAYRNNNFYLTSSAQYADARMFSIQAAGDIFGPCSPQQVSTRDAWSAVGVNGIYNPLPFITSVNNGPLCPGNTLNLTSSGGVSYAWSGPGGYTSTAQNPVVANVSASQAGAYTVVVTDVNGCSGTKTNTLFLYPQPSATASSSVTVCPGDSVNLTSTGTAFGVGGPPVSNVSTQVINIPDINLTGITSAITVSNAGNANQLLSVRIDSLIHTWVADLNFYIIAPNLSQIPLAIGVGNSGDNFLHTNFSAAASNVIGTPGNNTAPFNGTYAPQTPFTSLTGLANGQWKLKVVDAISQDVGTLYGWTITLSGPNGITSYSWSPSSGLTSSVVQNPKAGPAATTSYQVTVSDLRGCTATASTTVNINPLVLTKAVSGITCNGLTNGAVDLTVTGGNAPLVYSWSTGSTNQDIGPLGTGTYTVTVTDALGCSKTTTAVVTQPAILAVNGAQVNPSCAGVNNGSVAQTITGGTAPYTYAWSNGATTKDITGLGPGSYLVTVTDFNGCTVNNGYILAVAPTITVNGTSADISCNGGSNGSVNITVGGGTSPYLFSWSNGATTEDINALATGGYQVTVTDASGCTKTGLFTVNQPALISLSSTTANPTCTNSTAGQVNLSVSGGTPGYTFGWSNGATTEDISGLTSGTYTVTVTDLNGCSATHQAVLTGAVALNVVPTTTPVTCNGSANGTIQLNVSGGVPPYAYLWTGGSTSQNRSGLSGGSYTVTISDQGGCTYNQTYTINEPAVLTLSSSILHVSCKNGSDGSIAITPAGGTAGYSYLWNNGSTLQTAAGLVKGTYTVTVTDAQGCTKTASGVVTQPATLISLSSSKTNVRCYGALTGIASVSASGATPPYSYLWDTSPVSTSASVSGLAAGNYTCTVTDFKGCTKTVLINITQPPQIVLVTSQSNVTFPGGNNGSASVSASGGTPPFTYLWNTIPAGTSASVTGLTAGVYKIKVIDSKSCFQTATVNITEPILRPDMAGIPSNDGFSMKVYPNPGQGIINADFISPGLTTGTISLIDYTGRLVYSKELTLNEGSNTLIYDFTTLPKGIYLMLYKSASYHKDIRIILQ